MFSVTGNTAPNYIEQDGEHQGRALEKWKVEDLAFKYRQPVFYKQIAKKLAEKRSDREYRGVLLMKQLSKEIARLGTPADLACRPKHIYSIYRKMRSKGLTFESIRDLTGVRVIVSRPEDCYKVLHIAHRIWRPVQDCFDDYIAIPKINGYQSLHTAVTLGHGRYLEIQIRTAEMHEAAESGPAAHWQYKRGEWA